jgi:two-component system response regulator
MSPGSVEILLVEDNPYDVEMTMTALRKNNLANNVRVLQDGAEAVDYIFCSGQYDGKEFSQCPKVILLDLKLPKMDGIEVLRRIRGDERTKLVPVVVLTSSSEDRDRLETYKLGINSYIVKPVDFDQFIKAVEEIGLYWLLLNRPPY